MIRTTYPLLSLLVLVLASCAGQGDSKTVTVEYPSESETACYRYAANKDTILLRIRTTGTKVNGTLVYNLFEKDKNTGTIEGELKGRTITADYTFMSEGVTSMRKVVLERAADHYTISEGDMKLYSVACEKAGN